MYHKKLRNMVKQEQKLEWEELLKNGIKLRHNNNNKKKFNKWWYQLQ
jgi:hypothetical protein